jgi:YqaJ-like viral recombinase domain
MSPTIIDCVQGTPEWFQARLGIPTASEFSTVMAAAKDGKERKTRNTYMRKLAGEIITGEPMENYRNADMDRGNAMEAEVRDYYEFKTDAELQRIGFVINGSKGCSPDSFVGDVGMLEIKTAFPHILIEKILADDFPPEHKAQTQGALWVCEKEWIDLAIYWPKMPMFVKRAYREPAYIRQISDEVDQFNVELGELVERIRRYGT